MTSKILYIFLILLLAPSFTLAANSQDVLINEIAWMGTATSANDEWLELFNTTNTNIDLSGWTLKSTDGKLTVILKNQIPSKSFYLLERTDDSTVLNIPTDLIYSGSLNNSGLSIVLYDNANNVIDQADFATKWPAGNNITKQTMERTGNSAWQTSRDSNGTPKAQNSPGITGNAETQKGPAVENKTMTKLIVEANYPGGIFINEVLPAPEGPDETNEWIELYNQNDFSINLQGWKIKDEKGGTTTHTFTSTADITGKGYLVLRRPQTKITLNNDEDNLNLILPNGNVADSMNYKNAVKNQSYNKIGADWKWSRLQTPGAENTIGANYSSQTSLLKQEKSDNNTGSKSAAAISNTAPLGKNLGANNNPWFLFIIAIVITIISGVVTLILKLTVFRNSKT